MSSSSHSYVAAYCPATFILGFPSTSVSEFSSKCREFYRQSQDARPARRLLVYAGLFGLAAEYSALDRQGMVEYYAELAKKFQQLVLHTLSGFPLIVEASMESIEALMAGSYFAIDICKPSLSQTLTSAAARLCQILGYHRFSTMTNDIETLRDRKVMLFWLVYVMDKMVSLRLGHASAIQDFEVSLPKPQPSENFPAPLVHLMTYWIDVGRIQGQIGEQLFSPTALTQPNNVRASRGEKLAKELHEVYEVREEVSLYKIHLIARH